MDDDGLTTPADTASLAQANEMLALLRPRIDELVAMRADLAELQADMMATGSSPLGGLAEAKGLEARLFALLDDLTADGVQVKGYAPVLLDFPGVRDGREVLWCWLEGDEEITWYHRIETGFAGRRRV